MPRAAKAIVDADSIVYDSRHHDTIKEILAIRGFTFIDQIKTYNYTTNCTREFEDISETGVSRHLSDDGKSIFIITSINPKIL